MATCCSDMAPTYLFAVQIYTIYFTLTLCEWAVGAMQLLQPQFAYCCTCRHM